MAEGVACRALHKNPGFLFLCLMQCLSQFSEFTFFMAVLWGITETSSSLSVGTVVVCNLLPGLIFSTFAGILVDRFDRRRIVLFACLARAVVAGMTAFLWTTGPAGLGVVLLAVTLMSILGSVFNPAYLALLPRLVSAKQLQRANSISNFILNASYAAGSFLSAFLLTGLGYQLVITVAAALFACAGPVFLVARPAALPAPTGTVRALYREIGSTVRWVAGRRWVVDYIILAACVNVFLGSIKLLPVFIKSVLGETVIQYGLVEGFSVAGVLLATFLLARARLGRPSVVMRLAVGAMAVLVGALALCRSIPYLIVVRVMLSFCLACFNVLYTTQFHALLSPEYHGRVFALSYIISTVPYVVSAWLTGLVAEFIPVWVVWIAAAAIGLLLVGAYTLRYAADKGEGQVVGTDEAAK